MNIQKPPVTAPERLIGQLVERAAQILRTDGSGVPEGFAARLFGHASAEDLSVYTPEEIAGFAAQAYAFLAQRRPGAPSIRIYVPQDAPEGGQSRSVSVLEIVNDDMPFLVDSVMGELTARHAHVRLIVHPIFAVARDAAGRIEQVSAEEPARDEVRRESFMHVHLDRIDDVAAQNTLILGLEQVLSDVTAAVHDWRPMLAHVGDLIAGMKASPPPLPEAERTEAVEFMEWLVADNFTFLGIREYRVTGPGRDPVLVPDSGLGVLRRADAQELKGRAGQDVINSALHAFYAEPTALMITKASLRSRVHRRVFMDMVSVKRFDANGNVSGELRIVGLFTSTAYTRSTRSIPYLRRKVDALLKRARFSPSGHSGKALVNALETYPRDDLFRIDDDLLFEFAMLILQLGERPRVRVLARRDRFDRFMSVLVYLPRARSSNDVVEAVGELLAARYKGHVSGLSLFFPEGPLMRAHFIIGRSAEPIDDPERSELEAGVSEIVRTWVDALGEQLAQAHDPDRARKLFERYRKAFSASFRDRFSPETALDNIRTIEGLSADRPLSVDFHLRPGTESHVIGLKVWSYGGAIPLSSRVPMLENMGFKVVAERTYEVRPGTPSDTHVWMHDMTLESADRAPIDVGALQLSLESCFLMVMRGIAENDGYNALVLKAGLQWRDIVLIRSVSRFLRQVRLPFSQDYMWATLRAHPAIASKIVELFHARFDPRAEADIARKVRQTEIVAEIEAALENVPSLDEDRILRHFVNAVQSAIRTNFYQIGDDGRPKQQIAIKYESGKLTTLPAPRPLYEIFVYSPRVEGVHLRFGKVARGGIRWSDRPQDFRTEVLGLVKAQQVKNAVIVPVGAKGGFVPKHLPVGGAREAIAAEGIAAYKLFIGSLLDVTDNL
ncbi:MAG: NAD-glutamate dehydrogenase domain-containing protein, partial [Pseudorhodoplanes sp.]